VRGGGRPAVGGVESVGGEEEDEEGSADHAANEAEKEHAKGHGDFSHGKDEEMKAKSEENLPKWD
jgi:hypothetical protein